MSDTTQINSDINSVAFNELPRIQQCKKIRSDFKNRYGNWIKLAQESNSYLRGTHFTGSRNALAGDYFPEDRGTGSSDEKLYPSIGYTLKLIDTLTQYIQEDRGDIVVTAEGKYAFPTIDPRLASMVDSETVISENELVARMLTARLDLFAERSGVNRKLDEIAREAAANRTAFVVISWVDDETSEEPVKTDVINPGRYWFDPTASCIDEADYLGYDVDMDKGAAERKWGEKINAKGSSIKIYHTYTRDYTIKELTDEASEEANVSDGVIYKYPGAWRYTVSCKDQILYDGEMETPTGRPPICIFTWRPLPKSMIGVSVLDSTRTINNNIDRTVQYIMETAYKSLSKTAVDKAQIDDPNVLQNNGVGDWLFFDSTKAVTSATPYQYVEGGPIPAGLYTLLDTLKALGEEMCGVSGIVATDLSKFVSGDAIEGIIKNDRTGPASHVKDCWYLFQQDYFELVIRFIMQNEVEEVSLTIDTPAGEMELTTSIDLYEFDDDEFESFFDVSVSNPKNLPANPVKRNALLMGLIDRLNTSDIASAKLFLDLADLPYKASFKDYIEQREARELAAAQAAAQAPQQQQLSDLDKFLLEAKNKERETILRLAADASKSVSDGLESLAKQVGETDPVGATEILLSIPLEASKAYQFILQLNSPTPVIDQGAAMQAAPVDPNAQPVE